jgi:hypothetical protein
VGSLFDSPPRTCAYKTAEELQFVSGDADGDFFLLRVWIKRTIEVVRDRFISFIDLPGSKISLELSSLSLCIAPGLFDCEYP